MRFVSILLLLGIGVDVGVSPEMVVTDSVCVGVGADVNNDVTREGCGGGRAEGVGL